MKSLFRGFGLAFTAFIIGQFVAKALAGWYSFWSYVGLRDIIVGGPQTPDHTPLPIDSGPSDSDPFADLVVMERVTAWPSRSQSVLVALFFSIC